MEYRGKLWDVGTIPGFIKATIDLALLREDVGEELMIYLKEIVIREGGGK